MDKQYWKCIFEKLEAFLADELKPSVSEIAAQRKDPFAVLISTMISLRTKDTVTIAASGRLLEAAPNPERMAELSVAEIGNLIYPAGFYKTKAKHIKEVCTLLAAHGGSVPSEIEELLSLPGVGRKTANLVLALGFGKDALCVDTHVHRISNRVGWVSTKTPEKTEYALMEILPRTYWLRINEMLVAYGQRVCVPISPRCSLCVIREHCRRVGVEHSR